jgi:DNA-binding NtrC family response regulator
VTQPPGATTVWIVDDDLGFVWWLGEIFTEAGCRALPALSCEEAVSLIGKLSLRIDVLVLNPQLPGVIGMLQIFRRAHPNFQIVTIGKASPALNAAIRPKAKLERPSGSHSISHPEWLKKVRKLLKEVGAGASAPDRGRSMSPLKPRRSL